ncbi:conserved hypothetical protein [Catalinimonas alkaloidigena]|uniref:Purine nucleoside phosphorylase n=1 Tax=Catalinimonas alkaloidigena TaxID=1075417 RepID=A0A1G9BAE1_9BACT|nr:peptidoglycan editing factor PgeF [Catalinimonas alkaloidigena]SDK36491.1 conserved hypothetical protein [Catalinimonas alkaloidigena]
MHQQTFGPLTLWQFDHLATQSHLRHFVSDRRGGMSHEHLGALNLSFRVGDAPAHVEANRARVAEAMGVTPDRLFIPQQTHSAVVAVVDKETRPEALAETDGLVTSTPGVCIAVLAADCVPIVLYDPVRHVAAAVHAGWRGTVGRILTNALRTMQDHFGTHPAAVLAGIGPSISAEVYEVGPEVVEEVNAALGEGFVRPHQTVPEKGYVDLWNANRHQLLALGVRPESIEVAGICTYQHHDQFFSARRSRNNTGRFSAGIVLQPR